VKAAVRLASLRTWRVRALGAATGALVVVLPVVAIEDGRSSRTPTPRHLPSAVSAGGLIERTGVRVVRVAASGGGGLLDLRYQVVDPGTAAAVHDADTPPALVDERTGLVLGRLLMGHMPHARPKPGVSYYLVFMDPGHLVRRGDRVSVVLGPARLEHVLVR
jgi:hypothetical protein